MKSISRYSVAGIMQNISNNQLNKAGKDYFVAHIMTVVNSVDATDEKTVAALHDIVEDTDVSFAYLIDEGFSPYEWKTMLRRSGMIQEIGEQYLSTLIEICVK